MKLRRLILVGTAVIVVTALTAAVRFYQELSAPYIQPAATGIFVDIPRGSGTSAIAELLAEAGVIKSRLPFLVYVRWTGLARRLKAGEYRFATPATPVEVAARIVSGDVYYVSVTIPEGLTAPETVELLARNGVADAQQLGQILSRTDWISDLAPNARDLEGFLFPETYRYPRRATSEEILKPLADEFRSRFTRLIAQYPVPAGWTPAEIVTLASLIEKEVKVPEELPIVASVLLNRLRIGMPLDCDATIVFALKSAGKYNGNLHKSDLMIDSAYNTYTHKGLPPGPIANAGAAALQAALRPAHSDYLYYVSRNDGTHHFSRDYNSHLTAVGRYQKARGQGQGSGARGQGPKQVKS
jgi:UPF0755 protein